MAEQFSLFGDSVPKPPASTPKSKGAKGLREPYSLFFSLFPTPEDAVEIAEINGTLLRTQGLTGKALLPHRLHVTCHDLGISQSCRKTWWTPLYERVTRWRLMRLT